MAKTRKSPPDRSILRHDHIQHLCLEFIREYGQEEMTSVDFDGNPVVLCCYDTICSRPQYYAFKKKHPEFVALIEEAKVYYLENAGPSVPSEIATKIRANLRQAMQRESEEGHVVTKTRTQKDCDGNVLSETQERIVSPPRDYLFKKFLPEQASS